MNIQPYLSQKKFTSNYRQQPVNYESFKVLVNSDNKYYNSQRRNTLSQNAVRNSKSPNPRINKQIDTSPFNKMSGIFKSQAISPQNGNRLRWEDIENISPEIKLKKRNNPLQRSEDRQIQNTHLKQKTNSASPSKINPQIQSSLEQIQNLEQQRVQCKIQGNHLQGVLSSLHNKIKSQNDKRVSPTQQQKMFFSSKKQQKTQQHDQLNQTKLINLEEQLQEAHNDKKQLIENIKQYKINFERLQCLYSALQIKSEADSQNEQFISTIAQKLTEIQANISNSQHKALQINIKDLKVGQSEKYSSTQLLLIQKICDLVESSQAKIRNQEFLLIDVQQNQYKMQNELNSLKEKNYHLQNILSNSESTKPLGELFIESPTAKKMIFVLENELKIKDNLVNNLMHKIQGNEENTLNLCQQILKTIDKTCSTQDNFHENLTRILENQKQEIEIKNNHIDDLNSIISKYKSYFKIIEQEVNMYDELQLKDIQFNKQNFDKLIDLIDNMDQKIKIISYENQSLKQNSNFNKLQEINIIERQYFETDLNFKKEIAIIQSNYEFETKFLEIIQDYTKLTKQNLSLENQQGMNQSSLTIALMHKVDQDLELAKKQLLDIQLQINEIKKDMKSGQQDILHKNFLPQKQIQEKAQKFSSPQQETPQKPSDQNSNKTQSFIKQEQSLLLQQQSSKLFSNILTQQQLSIDESSTPKIYQKLNQNNAKIVLIIDCIIGLKIDKVFEKIQATHSFLKIFLNNEQLQKTQNVPINDLKFNKTYEFNTNAENSVIKFEIWMLNQADNKEIYFSESVYEVNSSCLTHNASKIVQSKINNYQACLYFKVKFVQNSRELQKLNQQEVSESFTDDIKRILPQINDKSKFNQQNTSEFQQSVQEMLFEDNFKKCLTNSSHVEKQKDQKTGITPLMIKNQKANQIQNSKNKSINFSPIREKDDKEQKIDSTPSFVFNKTRQIYNQNTNEKQSKIGVEKQLQYQDENQFQMGLFDSAQYVENYKSENQFIQPQDNVNALQTPKLKLL
ncbi:hypothetical protein TTHERM_00348210 (macronuclear) [Tetrahymena thermophila SB210]|uniref:Uncharacterized protein n=1 Tax=Tetrahymena thermophila (strain SB210) TaxID=312017 RepID=I7MH97_TETTS|nr:hypothetical protein TTHERM_00348210 [Tetrahymena thermophila SB210]EAS02731.2 hypothetical protein TTHERM_00348210 [Tetrahymena thermophila SB210]|eukprot:XP_001022976.2 hypothetical protein TTHERM_00348210 [Tetrahymena thermophila SB210]